MGRGAWWATVHRVTKSQTRLSDWAQYSSTITLYTCVHFLFPYLLTESNNFMVRSIFSIFVIKKYHCSPVVHMICHDHFYFQIFLLSLELIHLKIGLVVSEFIISLMPVSSLEVYVFFPYGQIHQFPLLGVLSPRVFWPAPSVQVTLWACCSVCILGSPITILEVPFSSFCTWLPCFPVTVTTKRKCLRICVSENVLSSSSHLKALLYMELWVRNNFLSNYENVSLTSSSHCCWKVQSYSYSCSLYITCLSISL